MTDDREGATRSDEHLRAVEGFLAAIAAVPETSWHAPRGSGRWSPAALSLHVCQAYEFGRDAATTGAAMRLKVPAAMAWVSRVAVLPILLALDHFPRGADAPEEVVPNLEEARQLDKPALTTRLRCSSAEAIDALGRAARDQPALRVTHAYFGAMPPLLTLRVLSAHTRHHAKGLAAALTIESG